MKNILTKVFAKWVFDKHWNMYNETANIKEYLNYFIKMPSFEAKGESQVPSGIDWKQNLYTIMRNEYGYDRSEILNMSIRLLFYEWVSYAEKNGGIKVSNRYEIESLRQQGVKV